MKFGSKVSFNGEIKGINWKGLKEGVAEISLEGMAKGEVSFSISRDEISTSHLRIWGENSRKAIINKLPKDAQKQALKQVPLQLAVPEETEHELKQYISHVYENRLIELKNQPIELRFKQKTMWIDGIFYTVDEWKLDEYEIATELLKDMLLNKHLLFGVDVRDKDLMSSLESKGLLKKETKEVDGEEVTDYIAELTYSQLEELVDDFAKESEKELEKKIDEIASLSPEEIVKKYLVGQVHVTEDGYFSDCPPYCDDCFWYSYLTKEVPEKYHRDARRIIVRNKDGKDYVYSIAYPEIIRKIAQDRDLIEKIRKEKIDQISRKLNKN